MSLSPVGEANLGVGSGERRRGAMRSLIEVFLSIFDKLYSWTALVLSSSRRAAEALYCSGLRSYVQFPTVDRRLPARSSLLLLR